MIVHNETEALISGVVDDGAAFAKQNILVDDRMRTCLKSVSGNRKEKFDTCMRGKVYHCTTPITLTF